MNIRYNRNMETDLPVKLYGIVVSDAVHNERKHCGY